LTNSLFFVQLDAITKHSQALLLVVEGGGAGHAVSWRLWRALFPSSDRLFLMPYLLHAAETFFRS